MTEYRMYRIVKRAGRYRIQYRFLHFFWVFHKVAVREEDDIGHDFLYYEPYETDSLEEASDLFRRLNAENEQWTIVEEI